MATQGEKITEIGTKLEFLVGSMGEVKESLKTITENQKEYATKTELKTLSETKAGIWTESWVKYIAFATGGVIIVDIIRNLLI